MFLVVLVIPDKYYFDKIYREKGEFKFGCDKRIFGDILKCKASGKVLDLGCGESGLGLELASKGFDVTCLDISKKVIKEIKKEAREKGVCIMGVVVDIENYEIEGKYDVVIMNGVLQFLGKDGKDFLRKIKGHTTKNGINVIDAFLNRWIRYGDYLEIYGDWEKVVDKKYVSNLIGGGKKEMVYLVFRKEDS